MNLPVRYRMYSTILVGQLSIILGATTITWSSPMLSKFNTTDNPLGRIITSSENSWLASISMLGEITGSLLFGVLTTTIGRKTILTIIGFPFLIFYTLMAFAESIWLFYVGRFFTGFGLGGISTVLSMYTFELSDPNSRGFFGSSMLVLTNVGLLMCYVLGPFVSVFWFHITLAALAIIYIPLVHLFGQETPHFLIQKNYSRANDALKKLRRTEDVSDEIEQILKEIKKTSGGSYLDLIRTKGLRKSFFIGFGLITFMQFTGTGIIMEYTQTIFENVGNGSSISPEICPIITGIVQLVVTMITSLTSDRFNRKILLMISHTGVAMEQIPFGLFFYLQENGHDVSSINWLPLVCLIFHIVLFNIGIGPLMTTVVGELFPLKVKGPAMSCSVVYMSGSGFLLALFFNKIKAAIGLGYTFWIFSASGFCAALFVKLFVIETKGKSLQEIQEELNIESGEENKMFD